MYRHITLSCLSVVYIYIYNHMCTKLSGPRFLFTRDKTVITRQTLCVELSADINQLHKFTCRSEKGHVKQSVAMIIN